MIFSIIKSRIIIKIIKKNNNKVLKEIAIIILKYIKKINKYSFLDITTWYFLF